MTIKFVDKLQDEVKDNITNAQLAQQNSYAKRHPLAENIFKIGDKVLVKNLRRADRKGGWISMPWLGPFTVHDIINKKKSQLKTDKKILKSKVLISNIKKYFESDDQNEEVLNTYNDLNKEISSNIVMDQTQYNSKNWIFNPVSKSWQHSKCRILKFNLINEHHDTNAKVLTVPSKIKNILKN